MIKVTDEMVEIVKHTLRCAYAGLTEEDIYKIALEKAIEASEEIQELVKRNEILQKQIRILETGGDNIVNDINEALCFLSKYAK